jgi:hypothetical protein
VRQAGDELQRRLPSNALLRDETVVQSAACARSSRTSWCAKPDFSPLSVGDRLEFTSKSGKSNFFRFHIAVTGERHADLRAELLPVALILPVERP